MRGMHNLQNLPSIVCRPLCGKGRKSISAGKWNTFRSDMLLCRRSLWLSRVPVERRSLLKSGMHLLVAVRTEVQHNDCRSAPANPSVRFAISLRISPSDFSAHLYKIHAWHLGIQGRKALRPVAIILTLVAHLSELALLRPHNLMSTNASKSLKTEARKLINNQIIGFGFNRVRQHSIRNWYPNQTFIWRVVLSIRLKIVFTLLWWNWTMQLICVQVRNACYKRLDQPSSMDLQYLQAVFNTWKTKVYFSVKSARSPQSRIYSLWPGMSNKFQYRMIMLLRSDDMMTPSKLYLQPRNAPGSSQCRTDDPVHICGSHVQSKQSKLILVIGDVCRCNGSMQQISVYDRPNIL